VAFSRAAQHALHEIQALCELFDSEVAVLELSQPRLDILELLD
jgi:hypothetical protein